MTNYEDDFGYGNNGADSRYGYDAAGGQLESGPAVSGRAAPDGGARARVLSSQQIPDPSDRPATQQQPRQPQQSRAQQQSTRQIPINERAQAGAHQADVHQVHGQHPYGRQPSAQRPTAQRQPSAQRPTAQQQPQQQPTAQQQPQQQPAAQQQPQQQPAAQGGFVSALDTATSRGGRSAYDQYSRGGYSSKRKPGMSRGKKAAIVVAIVVVIAAIAAGAAYAFSEMRKAEVNADLHSMDEEELEAIDQQLTGHTDFSEPFTVLLLGSDERTDDPEMGARTDTIILVRVDPVEKIVSMVSIPRDTMVNLPGVGAAKINAAYYYGGAAGTIAAVKELTGVDIDHYVSINFDGLIQLVDAIGGIDVYVDERIDDWKAGDQVVEAGQQHLNGVQALVLARSRDYADGDYTRQVNQRKVIMAIVEKAMNAPATELAGLIQASTSFIQTDSGIDFDWIYSLADQIRHTKTDEPLSIASTTIPSRPAYIGEVSYVIADVAGTAELMQILLAGGDVSQALTQSSISTDVENAGGNYSAPEGYVEYEEDNYYYEEPEEYYEEPAYVEPEPSYEEPAEVADDVGAEADGEES